MFTETYIKMATLAEPIQGMRQKGGIWKRGDWFCYTDFEGKCIQDVARVEFRDKEDTWLPLLNQLCDLSGLEWWGFLKECLVLNDGDYSDSLNETGIEVVMKVRFNRRWSGEGWEDIR